MLSIMKNRLCLAIGLTTGALLAQDAKTVLQNAGKAMGSVKSIQYSGTGMNAFFGQALTAGKEWPRRDLTSYSRTINYDQKSASEEFVFANQNVFGGSRQNNEVNGDKAWNVGANGAAAPQLANAEERQLYDAELQRVAAAADAELKNVLDGQASRPARRVQDVPMTLVTAVSAWAA